MTKEEGQYIFCIKKEKKMIYLDTVGIKFLANELNENLKGNRINKINAYDKNSFLFFVAKKTYILIIA